MIGWDAADWVMIRPLIQQGLMPTFAKLIGEGVSGKLATVRPILSPMLWNSIATGKRADKHGICGFTEPMPDGSGIRPVTSTSRKCKALWNILTQNDLTSNVVGWFASHPAEPIRGTIVTDYYVHPPAKGKELRDLPAGVCHPKRLEKPLSNLKVDPIELDAQAVLPFIPRAAEIDTSKDNRLGQLAMLLGRTSSIHAATCAVMNKEPWDFMAVYYDAIDQFGHHFMPYHPPAMEGISSEDAELYKDVMVGCYRFHDMMLETLLNYAGEDTTIILVSDHGFHSGEGRLDTDGFKDPTGWHRPYGVACIKGPGIKKNESLYGASLLDVTPTVLSMFGLPIGDDMDGRPWVEIYEEPVSPARIPSWEDVEGDAGMHSEDKREDVLEASEALKHLVDLGYIDAPSDDIQATIDKTKSDLKTNLAAAFSDSPRLEQALPLWQELLEDSEQDSQNRIGYQAEIARCYMQLGRLEESEKVIQELLKEIPGNPAFLMQLGRLQLQLKQPKEALANFQQAEKINPKIEAIQCAFGQAYLQMSEYDDAEKAYLRAIEDDDESAAAYNGMAAILNQRKQFSQAVDYALHAVGLARQFPQAHYNLGVALEGCNLHKEALQAYETCIKMAPEIRDAQTRISAIHATLQNKSILDDVEITESISAKT